MAAEASQVVASAALSEPIHVFGTDLAGRHDLPSAAFALRLHGAQLGKASGASGNAYAIPYRGTGCELLPLKVIGNYVRGFLTYAAQRRQDAFQIARFACEPDAYEDAKLAVQFATAPPNCHLPGVWQRCLDRKMPARLLLFDPSGCLKDAAWHERVRQYLDLNVPLWNVPQVEVVSVGAARSVVANDGMARSLGLKHRIIGANDGYFGRDAVLAAEAKAVWYATHFLALCDFEKTSQSGQIRITATAMRGGLHIDQINVNDD